MTEADSHSVTGWIDGLKKGDPDSTSQIFDRYYQRLVSFTAHRLRHSPRRAFDEEDVVQSSLKSFCLRAQHGEFPQLRDRSDLWQLLVRITAHKACNHQAHEMTQKRGGGRVLDESSLVSSRDDTPGMSIDQTCSSLPTPEFSALMAEQVSELLRLLPEDVLRQLAIWKMEGYTHQEIADRLGRHRRSVQRMLDLIRRIWEEELGQ